MLDFLDPDETTIPYMVQRYGAERFIWASDFPHWDHEYPDSLYHIYGRKDLTDEQKKAILRDNALEFYEGTKTPT